MSYPEVSGVTHSYVALSPSDWITLHDASLKTFI